MTIQEEARKESFEKAKPNFTPQEQCIIEKLKGKDMTPGQMYSELMFSEKDTMLLTSVRRAMTNLCKRNIIEAIKKQRSERGGTETLYRLVKTLFENQN